MRHVALPIAIIVCAVAWVAVRAAPINDLPAPIITRQTVFSIPFTVPIVNPPEQPTEVRLLTSGDRGATWRVTDRVDLRAERLPYKGGFTFRAPADGEYWFAIRTVDRNGQMKTDRISGPELRVVVDTRPPPLDFSAARGSAGMNHSVMSNNGRPPSKPNEGAMSQSQNGESARTNSRSQFDSRGGPSAGAGFPQGTEWPADSRTDLPLGHGTAPIGQAGSGAARRESDLRDRAAADDVGPIEGPALGPSTDGRIRPSGERRDRDTTGAAGHAGRDARYGSESPVYPPVGTQYVAPAREPQSPNAVIVSPGNVSTGEFAPTDIARQPIYFDRGGSGAVTETDMSSPRTPRGGSFDYVLPPGEKLRMVNSTVFELDYDVESVGRAGIAKVELWVTRDGGRTWTSMGVDSDNRSPFRTAVDGEGVYGYRMTVESGSGLGGRPPQPGDLPEVWIGVDLTRPSVRLTSAEAGMGDRAGEIIIRYEANDALLSTGPITLLRSAQPGGPWTTIAAGLDNTGQYSWRFDNTVPDRIYLRLEVRDEAGNTGAFEAADPVSLERMLPQGRLRDVRPVGESLRPNSRQLR